MGKSLQVCKVLSSPYFPQVRWSPMHEALRCFQVFTSTEFTFIWFDVEGLIIEEQGWKGRLVPICIFARVSSVPTYKLSPSKDSEPIYTILLHWYCLLFSFFFLSPSSHAESWIRTNRLAFLFDLITHLCNINHLLWQNKKDFLLLMTFLYL